MLSKGAVITSIFALYATVSIAAPLPQLAGEGAACNSLLSSTDNGVGYGVENAEDGVAKTVSSTRKRQLAGEGAACNSLLSSTDNGVGYGVENAEDGVAKTVSSLRRRQLAGEGAACNSLLSSTDNGVGYGVENAEDGVAATVAKTGAKARRQLDKVSNGLQAVSNSAGTGAETSALTGELDTIDGESTSGAANLGAQIGNTEASTLEGVGSTVPKARRQLDKVAKGAQAISEAAHTGAETQSATTALENIDGDATSGAANLGADIGNLEASTLEDTGSAVRMARRQLDKVAKGAQAISDAAKTGVETQSATTALENIDGAATDGAASIGADTGNLEASTLEDTGSAV